MDMNYNDRPASVYENVSSLAPPNIHTSIPKAAKQKSNGSPHSDNSYKFDEINHGHNQHTCPNGNHSQIPNLNSGYNTTIMSPAPVSVLEAQQQISHRLQLNDSSPTNQSIAAVKAALLDAKSKFFGLNGYASNDNKFEDPQHLLADADANTEIITPQIQIIPKAQPKYQNIPENSAIYRSVLGREAPSSSPLPTSSSSSSSSPPTTLQQDIQTTPSEAHICDYVSAPQQKPTKPSNTNNSLNESSSSSIQTQSMMPSPSSASTQTPSTLSQTAAPAGYKQILLSDLDSRSQHPSQAVYMTTTVPQNIKGSKIAGRHTPTRNSLRHSRMLVVNKNYQGIQYPNPLNFKHPNFARILLILEVILGLIILFIGVWILFLAPSTRIQDNPYWSGLALFFAGTLGLILIRYHRIKRHKLRENCFIFLRADSYLLSMVAVLFCLVAFICAAIHFIQLSASDTKCASSDILFEHASCLCTFNSVNVTMTNNTSNYESNIVDESYSFHYRDLSCNEVNGEWLHILMSSFIFNFLGFLVSMMYVLLLMFFRHSSKHFYASVTTSTF